MADREKVINALGRCESYGYCKDTNCPYHESVNCLELLRKDALSLLKEQAQEQIVHCKDCKYGLYTGTEYHCDKHSGHENRLGEDQYYKEWHNGNWFCADGERR